MDSVIEARRAKFEAKYPPPYYISWNVDRNGYYSIHRDSTRKRHAECYDAKWQGYEAALDSLVVDLPLEACNGMMNGERVRQAIEKAGVKTK